MERSGFSKNPQVTKEIETMDPGYLYVTPAGHRLGRSRLVIKKIEMTCQPNQIERQKET